MKYLLPFLGLLLLGCTSPTPTHAPVKPANVIIRYDSIHHPAVADAGMVVSQNAQATLVGQRILLQGGNAVDAAVAVGFALAVTLPRAGNIGGSGFMLMHLDGEQTALDFRSAMPAAFDIERYRGDDGRITTEDLKYGAPAAGVPGTVAGLYRAWQEHGSLAWGELVQPAIELARNGVRVTHDLAYALSTETHVFRQFPASRQVFLNADETPLRATSLWQQGDLAWTLEQIKAGGADAFYRGAVADRLVAAMQRDGGYISHDDLARYEAKKRTPLRASYRGNPVITMPPVSGGGVTLLQMLKVLQHFDVAEHPQGSAASLHLLAEVMKQGAANRRFGLGDPDFNDLPIADMLAEPLIDKMADAIDLQNARPVERVTPMNPPPSRNTTHYSVVDQWGNAVSTTYTLGYSFGSGYVAQGTGVLLDNQMRNFTYNIPDHTNAPAPGKRMMSTMTPTIVLNKAGDVALVTGTPGGGRIINVVLQVLVNVVDYGMNVAEATHAPRIHQPWRSPSLALEQGFSADTVSLLRARGHQVELQDTMGSTQSIQVQAGLLYGAADSRRPDALAAGVQWQQDGLAPGEVAGHGVGSD